MKLEKSIVTHVYEAPCGTMLLGSLDEKICLCDWHPLAAESRIERRLRRLLNADFREGISPAINTAICQLDEYFAGKRRKFSVPLLFAGTEFQLAVWKELLTIPYGETISYGQMAKRIGCSSSVRAVANANGANAISIFAPCHRVIGSNGTLTGYGGGLPVKRFLLSLESPDLFFPEKKL